MTPVYRPDLTGHIALVTGGGRNIGRALAMGFADCGADVIVADTLAEEAHAVAAEIEKSGARALAFETDISDWEGVQRMTYEAAKTLGPIDILVNNAALFSALGYQDFQDIPLDEWKRVMDVNITGAFHCIRAVEKGMREKGWGRIVNVSSGSIRMGRPHFLHYVSSKSALVGMGRSLARELGPHGITVNTLLPGVVFTETQKGRLDQGYQDFILSNQCIPQPMGPDAMVGPVLFLCSDAGAFVTGQELAVDGGLTHG